MDSEPLPLVPDRYAPPPAVGAIFRGPPIGLERGRSGKYTVAAIVDLGFYENDPSYYQIVFRYWAPRRSQHLWKIEGADALAPGGLYRPGATEEGDPDDV